MSPYPQVLMLGNGINLAFGGRNWSDLLKSITKRTDLPDELDCPPMPLQAIIRTGDRVGETMREKKDDLFGGIVSPGQTEFLQRLLSLNCRDVLTTNYSYELECAALGRETVSEREIVKMMAHTLKGKKAEPKYLLHTYAHADFGGREKRIWHIHGEARKPDSMVIGHYYYAELLQRIMKLLDRRNWHHMKTAEHGLPYDVISWPEAFVFGDVYVLGFGFDLSEFDLWWLLNRKKREKAPHGKVFFFEMKEKDFSEKQELLRLLNVEIEDLGIQSPDDHDPDRENKYRVFYDSALERIGQLMHS